jgi:site-specific DNA-cytosine methylase
MKVAFFDTFAGCGGAAQGARQAGAVVPLAWEMQEPMNAVHRSNHPLTDTVARVIGANIEEDIRILRAHFFVWRQKGYHIHLHGSPPCQDLSNASRQSSEGGMGLVHIFLDIVAGSEPDSWSMENVLPVGKKLDQQREGTPWRVLNSADFGTPQSRRRVFAGSGWTATPTHAKKEWVSIRDALPHLEDEAITHLQGLSRTRPVLVKGKHTGENIPRVPPDGCITLDEPSYAVCASKRFNVWRIKMDAGRSSAPTSGVNPKTGKKEGGSGPLYRGIDEPSYTITTTSRKIVGDDGENVVKVRSLNVREHATLQGFPESYSFEEAGSQKKRWEMIGNAVCPQVMEAIIRGVGE